MAVGQEHPMGLGRHERRQDSHQDPPDRHELPPVRHELPRARGEAPYESGRQVRHESGPQGWHESGPQGWQEGRDAHPEAVRHGPRSRALAGPENAGWADRQRHRADQAARMVQGPVWRLLNRGIETFLPGRRLTSDAVRPVDDPIVVGPPAFATREKGFGLQLRDRPVDAEPRCEIFIRGKNVRSIGIVIAAPAAAIGSRVVDAAMLARYARRLTFRTLFDESDSASVVPALRAARALEYVVFLDPAGGIGLCAEIDPATRRTACPLLVRFGGGSWVIVYAYSGDRRAAHSVRSQY